MTSAANPLTRLVDGFSVFIDLAAAAVLALQARIGRVRALRIEEDGAGAFRLAGAAGAPFPLGAGPAPAALSAALKGRDVELVLDPARFLFRPLDLPQGATAFLDGIVRSQIDRLTPWSAGEAAYGWTAPAATGDERIRVMVAATARARLAPCLDALRALGVAHVELCTRDEADGALLPLLAGPGKGVPAVGRVRQVLLAVLGVAAVGAGLVSVGAKFAGAGLDAELEGVNQRIAAHRRAIAAARDGQGADGAGLRLLEQLKRERAPAVLVLEALSQMLPDHTHLTALQMAGDKVELTGVSLDAPSLVRLLEQSRRFSAATFIAPTTRQPGDRGERFQIEARITLPFEVPR
ncbi:PilN domain-containing protein [Xanthobacter sp. AM11]|uniref:PilN domain-containing protein n=1 Tax=Xanthobacter sp. AM11 TaxID=3380643 RepID=UPI0039BFE57A